VDHPKKGKSSHKQNPKVSEKRQHAEVKSKLHSRNIHNTRYDFEKLTKVHPELASFVSKNIYGDETIPFANPDAVKALNKALLLAYYDIVHWDIPQGYLCPPVPGRADYIHHAADVLSQSNYGKIPYGSGIKCLDIGVGANGIYPIVGIKNYNWSFVGSDIDQVSLKSYQDILDHNPALKDKVALRLQTDDQCIFKNIIQENEYFDLVICNPPFHASAEDAKAGSDRKNKHLGIPKDASLNFGGQSHKFGVKVAKNDLSER
jgi:23S rRNA (adenine1618-N6)-methyltransferase